jgi:hypothetical protein
MPSKACGIIHGHKARRAPQRWRKNEVFFARTGPTSDTAMANPEQSTDEVFEAALDLPPDPAIGLSNAGLPRIADAAIVCGLR